MRGATGSRRAGGPQARSADTAASGPTPSKLGPSAVLGVWGLGALAVVGLWWNSAQGLHGTAAYLQEAGRLLGLMSGYSVIVQVALMARIPPLERGVGTDRLARWHATNGRYVIYLISGHVIAIIWGYSATFHTNVVSETKTLLLSYTDVLMATVAWFLFLGIAFVSARAVRSRVKYETWYYLHFYTYLAIALAFSHQFADGASFINSLAARFWWSALYGTVTAAVLWFRVVVPAHSFFRHGFRVAGVRQEAPGIASVYISGNRLNELAAEPGQYFRWRFLTRGLWWSSHPYSLSAAPGEDMLRITVKAVGDHSRGLGKLQPGTRVFAEGPYGALTADGKSRHVVLLAGGLGITPLRALFATIPGRVTLIYRASKPQDVIFQNELDSIARDRGATVHYIVGSRKELGGDPLNARVLQKLAPGLHRQDVYLCGPPGMTEAAMSALSDAGVPRRRIHYESFEF
jgi:predicted ferric reductase